LAAEINKDFPPGAGQKPLTDSAVRSKVTRDRLAATAPPLPHRKPTAQERALAGDPSDVADAAATGPTGPAAATGKPKRKREKCTGVRHDTRVRMRQIVADYVQGIALDGGTLTYNMDGLKATEEYGSLLAGLEEGADIAMHEQKFAEIHHYAILKARGEQLADTDGNQEMQELYDKVKAADSSSSEGIWELSKAMNGACIDAFSVAPSAPGQKIPAIPAHPREMDSDVSSDDVALSVGTSAPLLAPPQAASIPPTS
jgi:hypothetical protein